MQYYTTGLFWLISTTVLSAQQGPTGSELQREIDDFKGRIAQLEAEDTAQQQNIRDYDQAVPQLKKEKDVGIQKIDERIDLYKNYIATYHLNISELEYNFKRYKASVPPSKQDPNILQQIRTEIKGFEDEIKKVEDEIENLKDKIANANKAWNDVLLAIDDKKKEAKKVIDNNKAQIDQIKLDIAADQRKFYQQQSDPNSAMQIR